MNGTTLLRVLDPAVGVTMLVVGTLVWRRGRAGAGGVLVLAGACWFAGAVVPALAVLHRGALVQLLATYPSGIARRPGTVLVVVAGWLLTVVGGLPGRPWATLATAALVGAVATVRATRTSTRGRQVLSPDVVGGLFLAAVLVVAAANLLVDLDADLAVALGYDVVVALLVVALGVDLCRTPATDDTVAEVLSGLGSRRDGAPGLQRRLRRVLGDPHLTIGYWVPDRGTYLDEEGRVIEPGASTVTSVLADGRPAAVLVHDPALSEDPGLLAGAAAAVRLTVANAALQREALDRVEQLAEVRRRIVQASDVEARALALRLEQGPQRRLREVSDALAGLDLRRCPAAGTARAVQLELQAAHRELQELAHGVRPRHLTAGGLALALPPLADAMPVATDVRIEVGRLDAAVEAGLYFFCAEGLANVAKHASASSVRVGVRAVPGAVVAEVVDDGRGGVDPEGSGLRGLRDRIEALGGTLEVGPGDAGGVRLVGTVPVRTEEQQ